MKCPECLETFGLEFACRACGAHLDLAPSFYGVRVKGEQMPLPVMFPAWDDASMSRLTHPDHDADNLEVVAIVMEVQEHSSHRPTKGDQ